ncbi:beta-ribofuranosylaminobenzene 5'-phosphate synthase [Candidatus Acidianus copahuensis]|uniref:Beta-ribofuranosylaminobenzene 5'-phosphate synthase n=1 Tax=Candidatus Acidianus copahuensis TaxID=1160895 RepID=A0A031LR70_9CREN|nr:beta-ribofuranosylaminobenzene 5'-phosphate synthase family protein [Candidatus Acidianus copahuensis]EZQ06884.1 beta-ribofuranosylaminobenzene 5'-phosphate synthase [Candidatus Acidianus copahuensis]
MMRLIGLSRIHITLFDLEGKYGRLDGGMGIALAYPRIVISSGNCNFLRIDEIPNVNYCIEEDYEEHVGLGHTTQLLLSEGKFAFEYNLIPKDVVEIAKIVKRGSTSGVGVFAFKYGGFVVDGGHSKKVKIEALPSDFSEAPPPPLIARINFPWYIYVNIGNGRRIFGNEEIKAFKEAKLDGIGELARIVLMEFIPSVAEKDLEGALDGLDRIQSLGFKKIEVSLQSDKVRDLMRRMRSKGFPAGLSSFGPAVFTFLRSRREGEELVSTFGGFISDPNNTGARVIWD